MFQSGSIIPKVVFMALREQLPEKDTVVGQTITIVKTGITDISNWHSSPEGRGLTYNVTMGSMPWNKLDIQEMRFWILANGYINPYVSYDLSRSRVTIQFEMP